MFSFRRRNRFVATAQCPTFNTPVTLDRRRAFAVRYPNAVHVHISLCTACLRQHTLVLDRWYEGPLALSGIIVAEATVDDYEHLPAVAAESPLTAEEVEKFAADIDSITYVAAIVRHTL